MVYDTVSAGSEDSYEFVTSVYRAAGIVGHRGGSGSGHDGYAGPRAEEGNEGGRGEEGRGRPG